ncbi:hypothetical protein F4777DRAFT_555090 [Nemania sp. FL0916]|nr:hypothetical protein F4777DRAFT_555090 [Nemania sp. FL0916]
MPLFYSKNVGGRHFGTNFNFSRNGVHRGPWRFSFGKFNLLIQLPNQFLDSYRKQHVHHASNCQWILSYKATIKERICTVGTAPP